MIIESLILTAIWLAYFVLHSLFASLRFKKSLDEIFPSFTPYYRLSFNVFALVSLLPQLILMTMWRGATIIQWNGWWFILMNGIALLAVAMFYHSIRFYDMSEFMGIRQVKSRLHDVNDTAPMCISPYHRFVRHPWYSFALVLIWTRDMDSLQLITSIAITLYFIFGSRLEEKKLLVYFGEQYSSYQKLVPGLLPLPWRFLGQDNGTLDNNDNI